MSKSNCSGGRGGESRESAVARTAFIVDSVRRLYRVSVEEVADAAVVSVVDMGAPVPL